MGGNRKEEEGKDTYIEGGREVGTVGLQGMKGRADESDSDNDKHHVENHNAENFCGTSHICSRKKYATFTLQIWSNPQSQNPSIINRERERERERERKTKYRQTNQ